MLPDFRISLYEDAYIAKKEIIMEENEVMLRSLDIPPVTKEFAHLIATKFYPRRIDTNSTIEEIMLDAGQKNVVEYIMAQAQISYRDLGYDIKSRKSYKSILQKGRIMFRDIRKWVLKKSGL